MKKMPKTQRNLLKKLKSFWIYFKLLAHAFAHLRQRRDMREQINIMINLI